MKKMSGLAIASLVCGLLFLVTYLGVPLSVLALILGTKALKKINADPEHLEGKGFAIAGILLGAIAMLIVLILGIFLFIARMPEIEKVQMKGNDSLAKATLFTLSTASETYATINDGKYPSSVDDLTRSKDRLLKEDYCSRIISGYYFDCQFLKDGYVFSATPSKAGKSGTSEWTIKTGGIHDWRDMSTEK